eukprot:3460769-Rhodomonas_salina.1
MPTSVNHTQRTICPGIRRPGGRNEMRDKGFDLNPSSLPHRTHALRSLTAGEGTSEAMRGRRGREEGERAHGRHPTRPFTATYEA